MSRGKDTQCARTWQHRRTNIDAQAASKQAACGMRLCHLSKRGTEDGQLATYPRLGAGKLRITFLENPLLVRLYGQNFRSLRHPFELSMLASELTNTTENAVGVVSLPLRGSDEPISLLKCVGLFGANASGKSSVLLAAKTLRRILTETIPGTKAKPNVPYEPFLLDAESTHAPVELNCDVYYKKNLIRYSVQFSAESIISEQLSLLGSKSVKVLIDRSYATVGGQLIEVSAANKLYVQQMPPNISVVSKLAQVGPQRGIESVVPYRDALLKALNYRDFSASSFTSEPIYSATERFARDKKYRDWIMQHLMQPADVGICDYEVRNKTHKIPDFFREFVKQLESHNHTGPIPIPESTTSLLFVHKGRNQVTIPFENESAGTVKLFNISEDWWYLMNDQVTLFADEFGASIHPRLFDELIRVINSVNSADTKTPASQLIFTTHESSLLEGRNGKPPALRRDQVYFTSKEQNGESSLYSLSEFKDDARTVHNIRKRYMSGVYGALPSLEGFAL